MYSSAQNQDTDGTVASVSESLPIASSPGGKRTLAPSPSESGAKPCDNCMRREIACEYDAKYSRGRPPTPPPPPASVALPENGSEVLRVDDMRTSVLPNSYNNSYNNSSFQSHPRRPTNVLAAESSNAPSRTSPDLDVAEIEGQYFDTTSGLTFLHRAYKKLSTQRSNTVPSASSGTEKQQRLMTVGDRRFDVGADLLKVPDRATALALIRFYFDECVVTYRMFHRQIIVGWLEKLVANSENNLPLHCRLGHAKAATVLGILAVVTFRREKLRNPTKPGFDEDTALARSDPLFRAAVNLTDAETGLPRLESAQARLVQVLYLLQTSRMNEGCVAFGRPSIYRDEDIDQDFPDCVNDEDMTAHGPSGEEPSSHR
ncbi:hypothetical protein SAPIO_CDS1639 [Scedosporium apiospermum]|uniref:Transcription factor domain-containing protein n=1 Tax=Pseudallescheria apiosperma TaxID=563466 RepID=A0A084GER1_PSEDA|nr:uncharacterized protein SAPIO_CDS1639 [Scedosporium apiospermum]KEZ45823.1 hypothetical protein SAPIO_CDS1639 [Scedosporium apiospermum]